MVMTFAMLHNLRKGARGANENVNHKKGQWAVNSGD